MAKDKELERGLKAMADEFRLPFGGRMELSKLVAAHLDWFEAADRRGLKWPDMIRALAAAGINGRNGMPLSVGTLSSTVWRKRAEAEVAKASAGPRLVSPAASSALMEPARTASPIAATLPQRSKRADAPSVKESAQVKRKKTAASNEEVSRSRAPSRNDVLAYMDRARTIRRRSD
ncbi:hypothetical protein G8O24_22290 [Bradyrhizobium sp. INPA01-394B]|uniref:DUF1376 domain-containing protein n=1 Tax=Bradyrhizobium campsiandrae TaxID=1729892 RepID=A0ABR7U4Q7_9BRAD|nr:hypothetical protein [Bradyrhizobium campsiandrae]MBC9880065.1 hypothetical protein [Bradyrhizobium campsiandrae]MBC9978970.1 hypothetical protein [Bradyrhizobium campsiandrae]